MLLIHISYIVKLNLIILDKNISKNKQLQWCFKTKPTSNNQSYPAHMIANNEVCFHLTSCPYDVTIGFVFSGS